MRQTGRNAYSTLQTMRLRRGGIGILACAAGPPGHGFDCWGITLPRHHRVGVVRLLPPDCQEVRGRLLRVIPERQSQVPNLKVDHAKDQVVG